VTCHDGFTLNDLVSYRTKHNEANGEDNRDGTDANFSQNCGAEGATKDAGIEAVRKRQIKNFLLTLLISRGVPMLLGGDESRRTQGGNNNAYCQDNETSWFDWTDFEQHQEIYRFACGMIAFRGAHPVLSKEQFYTDTEIRWLNPAVDTSGLTPQDLFVAGAEVLVDHSQAYRLQHRSSAILLARGQESASGGGHYEPKGLPTTS
jgi:glycogen operon protein